MAINNPNPQSNRQLGTGFTNLQNIMGANTGNQLGQAVSSGIQQTGQQASNALNSGVQDFNTRSQNNALGTQAQKEDVQNTLNDTSNVDPTQVANFAKYRSGQYSGPQDISNIQNIQNQAQNAQQQGNQIGTAGGRQTLLQQYASAPGSSYSSGQQNLDSMLLGATGGQQLQQARQAVSGLTNQANSAESTAQQQAKQFQNQAQGFGQQVTGQVQNKISDLYNPANQQAQTANIADQKAQADQAAAVQNAQTNNQLSVQALQQLGLNAGDRTYGVNIGQYMGYNPAAQQATALNMMQQPQFQQYSGLQQLMGQNAPQAQPAYQTGQATYDKSGLQSAITAAKAPLDQVIASKNAAEDNYNQVLARYGNAPTGSPIDVMSGMAITKAKNAVELQRLNYTNLTNQLAGTINQTPPTDMENTPKVT